MASGEWKKVRGSQRAILYFFIRELDSFMEVLGNVRFILEIMRQKKFKFM